VILLEEENGAKAVKFNKMATLKASVGDALANVCKGVSDLVLTP
jgi:hypothetical protein